MGTSLPVLRPGYSSAPPIRKEDVTAASISRLGSFKESHDSQKRWLAGLVASAIENQSLREKPGGTPTGRAIYGMPVKNVPNQQSRFVLVATFDRSVDGKLELAIAILRNQITKKAFGIDTRNASSPTARQAADEQSVPAGSSAQPRMSTPEPTAAPAPEESADSLFGSSPASMEADTPSPASAVRADTPPQLTLPALPAGSDGGISPGSDNDTAPSNGSDLERDLLEAFDNLSSSSPSAGPDLPAGPPDPASPATGPSGAGSKRRASPSAADSRAKRPATQAGGAMRPPSAIPGTASAPIDLARATPAPSAALAADTQAQQLQRQPVGGAHKTRFDQAYRASFAELVKYFSDDELVDLSRDTVHDEAEMRATQCRAVPGEKKRLFTTLDAWFAESKAAIPDLQDDDPLLFAANGRPLNASMLAFQRTSRCNNMQPLPVLPPENNAIFIGKTLTH